MPSCNSEGAHPLEEPKRVSYSDFQVLLFIVVLCSVCALLLAVTAYALEKPQSRAKEFDQSKQMLIAAKILNHAGYFEILDEQGDLTTARFDPKESLNRRSPPAPSYRREDHSHLKAPDPSFSR